MNNVFADFLINAGLYEEKEINEGNIDELADLIAGDVRISCHCNKCEEKRVFSMKPIVFYTMYDGEWTEENVSKEIRQHQLLLALKEDNLPWENKWEWKNKKIDEVTRVLIFKFCCAMEESHHLDFVVLTNNHSLIKVGQYPSVADLTFPELKNYAKVLDRQDMKEMRRAIGLHAQGIGVGSYVYIRRILERLIERAQTKAIEDGKYKEEDFKGKKVVDRIKVLKDYLPEMLVSNNVLYGIISRGIHELSEESCIEYFPVIQECIFMILEQWEQERKKKESEQRINSALNKISSTIK